MATDYTSRRGPELKEQDKQEVAEQRAEAREGFIPKAGKNPALADLQQRREKQQEEQSEQRADVDADDERTDRSDVATQGDRRSQDAERTE
jgi:hypothetical protein